MMSIMFFQTTKRLTCSIANTTRTHKTTKSLKSKIRQTHTNSHSFRAKKPFEVPIRHYLPGLRKAQSLPVIHERGLPHGQIRKKEPQISIVVPKKGSSSEFLRVFEKPLPYHWFLCDTREYQRILSTKEMNFAGHDLLFGTEAWPQWPKKNTS